eukprot:825348-Pyramimonas_sp.AAC.1
MVAGGRCLHRDGVELIHDDPVRHPAARQGSGAHCKQIVNTSDLRAETRPNVLTSGFAVCAMCVYLK